MHIYTRLPYRNVYRERVAVSIFLHGILQSVEEKARNSLEMPSSRIQYTLFFGSFCVRFFYRPIPNVFQFLLCRLTSNHSKSSKKITRNIFDMSLNSIEKNIPIRSFIMFKRINNKGFVHTMQNVSETTKYHADVLVRALHWIASVVWDNKKIRFF